MPDIADQLRDWSKSLAGSVPPTEIDSVTSPVSPVSAAEAHASRRWLAVAASAVIVVGGIAAIATLSNDDTDRTSPATNPTPADTDGVSSTSAPSTSSTTAPTSSLPSSDPAVPPPPPSTPPASTSTTTSSTTSVPTTIPPTANPDDRLADWPPPPTEVFPIEGVPRYLPTVPIPATGVPVRGESGGGNAAQPTYTQVFADAERNIVVHLQTQPAGSDATPAELRQPVTIEGWDDAFQTVGSLRLMAFDPSGWVRLSGTGIDPDEAVSIVAMMQRRAEGLPGWDLAASGGFVEINGAWNDSAAQRFLTWFEGDRVVAQMLASPAHTDVFVPALGSTFERVDVNGSDAWLNSTDSKRTIVWSPDGTTVVVLAVVRDDIDPLVIARSVEEFDAAQYETATTTDTPAGVGDGCDGSLFC